MQRTKSEIPFGHAFDSHGVRAQPAGKVYRIGVLETIPQALNAPNLDALRRGLRERGYVEGKNFVIEYRSADGRADRFPGLATELVRLGVDLLVTRGSSNSGVLLLRGT